MPDVKFGCLPTMIGSLPGANAGEACALVARFLKDLPAWPQLPGRSPLEDMNAQFSEGFPGIVVTGNKLVVDRAAAGTSLELFYEAYLKGDIDKFSVSREYSGGLYCFLEEFARKPLLAAKGQMPGPVTWGLSVTDDSGKPILYDDELGEVLPRFLKLKAAWQESRLRQVSRNTILFLDEPYMASYGSSAATALSAQRVIELINGVFEGVSGLKGIHCCGNTDWPVLLKTNTDIISFDAYGYAASFALYPGQVATFLRKSGAVAWGIVPTDAAALAGESAASLKDRLEEAMAPFCRAGIPFRDLVARSLLTPSCGLASVTLEEAAHALDLLSGVSHLIRQQYL